MKSKKSLVFILSIIFILAACGDSTGEKSSTKKSKEVVEIQSLEEFQKIVQTKDQLLIFDLYADWCMPCKVLSPLLDKIAKENKGKAKFYKINVDKLQQVASMFQVSGIPYVVYVKNNNAVKAFTGVRTEGDYQRAIDEYSNNTNVSASTTNNTKADGKLMNGIREIIIPPFTKITDIYVYRGETVNLTFEKQNFKHSVHIPDLKISKEFKANETGSVKFKVKNIGVYPLFCNGDCPNGDGTQHANLIVLQYKSDTKAQYLEIDAVEADKLIKDKSPLVLDVRTQWEYNNGHIKNTVLIPITQLFSRVKEINDYKEKPVFVYCRSGNRSTVASQILIKKGFKEVYNLRPGIKGWIKADLPIIK